MANCKIHESKKAKRSINSMFTDFFESKIENIPPQCKIFHIIQNTTLASMPLLYRILATLFSMF